MGVATLDRNVGILLRERDDSTPVAIVERGCTPTQRVTLGTLGDIVERAAAAEVANPAVIVVGDVVRLAHDWPRPRLESPNQAALAGAGA